MPELNKNFGRLNKNYLFTEIARRVSIYRKQHPDADIISLGIGDITQPLAPCVVDALINAAGELGDPANFRGYPPESGYPFLKNAIAEHYRRFGVELTEDEIFVDDGAKSSLGGLVDIFGANTVVITDPVYPAYLDGNIIAGRDIVFLPAAEENNFLPMPPKTEIFAGGSFVIYLCSPNNPTGSVYNRKQLTEWVRFANATGSVIIFDAAYSAWLSAGDYPRSIFEIAGARRCAAEVNSLSKSAGFTNLRCSWVIIKNKKMNALWRRRQSAKFNGVSYIIQRAAEAALSPAGQTQCNEQVAYYTENAKLLTEFLRSKGAVFYGGVNSPYIWLRCPAAMRSWDFFDRLLNQCQIAVTPGVGFGSRGENFVRLSCFAKRGDILRAIERLKSAL